MQATILVFSTLKLMLIDIPFAFCSISFLHNNLNSKLTTGVEKIFKKLDKILKKLEKILKKLEKFDRILSGGGGPAHIPLYLSLAEEY